MVAILPREDQGLAKKIQGMPHQRLAVRVPNEKGFAKTMLNPKLRNPTPITKNPNRILHILKVTVRFEEGFSRATCFQKLRSPTPTMVGQSPSCHMQR